MRRLLSCMSILLDWLELLLPGMQASIPNRFIEPFTLPQTLHSVRELRVQVYEVLLGICPVGSVCPAFPSRNTHITGKWNGAYYLCTIRVHGNRASQRLIFLHLAASSTLNAEMHTRAQ